MSSTRSRLRPPDPPKPRTPAEYLKRWKIAPRRARTKKTLDPIFPNAAIEAAYREKLNQLISQMHKSLVYWISAAYKRNQPELKKLLAEDASPAITLHVVLRRLFRRWQTRFNEMAPELADYFATEMSERTDGALRHILDKGGITVRFTTTRAVNDVLQATINENVSLIRSIAQQHLTQVQGIVMRSVQAGRDLEPLAKDLQHQFGVTKRRAALIARDQNNKATSAIQRVRQTELGIIKAVWMHSHAGKDPRPAHVEMDNKEYNVAKGMWDKHERKWIHPGELVNCRCTSRPVLFGFS